MAFPRWGKMRNDTKGFSQQKTMFNFTPHRLWRGFRWTQAAQSGQATRLDARLMCRITSQTGPLECGLTGGSPISPSRLCLTPSVSSLDRQTCKINPESTLGVELQSLANIFFNQVRNKVSSATQPDGSDTKVRPHPIMRRGCPFGFRQGEQWANVAGDFPFAKGAHNTRALLPV